MWRDLLGRLSSRRRRRDPAAVDTGAADMWDSVGRLPSPSSQVLVRIEQTALEIYESHGLPTAPGHYRRARRARFWTFLGEHLTPEARWALLLDCPPEQGWRYGTLADIGRTGSPDIRAASALLTQCAHLQTWLAASGRGDPLEMMEQAIRLGVDWRALENTRSKTGTARLRLTAPDDTIKLPDRVKRPGRKKSLAK